MSPLLFGLALVVGAPALKDPPDTDPRLVGTWAVATATTYGVEVPDYRLTITFARDGTCQIAGEIGGQARSQCGGYTLDPKRNPAQLDLTEVTPGMPPVRTNLAIYKIVGDTLTLCLGGATDRPTEFEAAFGATRVLLVLQRVKDK
jgi:uncharacterized protein (TIGR03067 family)